MKNYINENFHFITDQETKRSLRCFLKDLNRYIAVGRPTACRFLNPTEMSYAQSILNKYEVSHQLYGGYDSSERKLIIFGDDVKASEFLTAFRSTPLTEDITHRDVLGALISLGVERSAIGDIVFEDGHCEFLVLKEVEPVVMYNLTSIKKTGCRFDVKDQPVLTCVDNLFEEKIANVSSMRLDSVVAAFIPTSRTKAKYIITSGRVKLNHVPTGDPDRGIGAGDTVSIRGLGRFEIGETIRCTKKGRQMFNYFKRI